MKLLKNAIVKNILLSFCGIISIGTVGTTIYNTVLVEHLKQQNNEIMSILEEKDDKISNLQQQLEETKTALTEVPKQSADKETTEENQNITSNANTNNIKTPSKPTQSASTYENTRETRKQELIKQRDELQKQIDELQQQINNRKNIYDEKKKKLDNEYYALIAEKENIQTLLNNTEKNSEQYNHYSNQIKELNSKIGENNLKFQQERSNYWAQRDEIQKQITSIAKQRDSIQQQINEL